MKIHTCIVTSKTSSSKAAPLTLQAKGKAEIPSGESTLKMKSALPYATMDEE